MQFNYTISLSFLLFSVLATAQSSKPEILWEKSYGGNEDDEFRSMQITDDGGFICTGYTISSNGDVDSTHGGADCWVVKFDSTGKIQWQRTYGGSSADWGRSITKTSDGGYIIAGYSKSNDGDVSGNHGDFDFLILKLNSSGNIEWQKSFGGSNFDNAYRAIETYDGKFVVVGFTESNDGNVAGNHGGQDFWILKLNGNGDILWKKTLGGTENEQASCVIETGDHDYAIIGFSSSDDNGINDHKGARDFWVVRISASGRVLWKKSYGGTNDDEGRWIEQTPDDGFLLFGYSTSTDMDVTTNNGGEDYWVVKTDANGNIQWERSYGGSLDEYPYYGHRCADGTIIIAGISHSDDYDATEQKGNGDYWVVKLEADGDLLWEKSFGGAKIDVARCSTPTSEGEMLIAGYSLSHNGDITDYYKKYDGWIVKTCTTPYAQIAAMGDLDICQAGQVKLKANTEAGCSYKWYKDGIAINNATNQTYMATEIADYEVKAIKTKTCTRMSAPVTVYTSCNRSGVPSRMQVSASPNPSDGNFSMHILDEEKNDFCEVTIFDITGNVVLRRSLNLTDGEATANFGAPDIAVDGIYFLHALTGKQVSIIPVCINRSR